MRGLLDSYLYLHDFPFTEISQELELCLKLEFLCTKNEANDNNQAQRFLELSECKNINAYKRDTMKMTFQGPIGATRSRGSHGRSIIHCDLSLQMKNKSGCNCSELF